MIKSIDKNKCIFSVFQLLTVFDFKNYLEVNQFAMANSKIYLAGFFKKTIEMYPPFFPQFASDRNLFSHVLIEGMCTLTLLKTVNHKGTRILQPTFSK